MSAPTDKITSPRSFAMKSRAKLVVAVIAFALAGAIGAWHGLHERLAHAGDFADASGAVHAIEAAAVRHAVFGRPEPLAGDVNSASDELRSTRSADGRWFVFAVGSRGANMELWIGATSGDSVRDLRLLTELDTSADECAPCFGADCLWFASDRAGGSGGLDIHRAPFDGETFGPVEHLPGPLQSARDDTDPTPIPGTDEIAFASDRSGTSALYRARAEAEVAPLLESSPWAAREPGFSADGRAVWFAVEHDGNFDIHRAQRRDDKYVDQGAVPGLDTDADERAPLVFEDGFEIVFARSASDTRGFDLARMRADEIMRVPGIAWTWIEIVTIAALLVLVLMAFVSDRWPGLDTLYRCYLASVLVHLLLALWMHHVQLGHGGRGDEPGRKVRVKLAPSASSVVRASRERAGDVSDLGSTALPNARAERSQLAPRADPLHESALVTDASELRPAAESALAAPARAGDLAASSNAKSSVDELRDVEARAPRSAGSERGLALEPSALANAPGRSSSTGPERGSFADASVARDETHASSATLGTLTSAAPAVALDAPAVGRSAVAQPTPGAAHGESLRDDEVVQRPAAVAGTGASGDDLLGGLDATSTRGAASTGPKRAQLGNAQTGSSSAAPSLESLTSGAGPFVADAPAGERSAAHPFTTGTGHGEAVRDQEVVRGAPTGLAGGTAEDDLLGGLEATAPRAAESSAPKRARLDAEPGDDAPATPALESLAAAPLPDAPPPAPPARSEWSGTPYENRAAGAKERALLDNGGSVETERAVERGLEYLASVQSSRGHWGPLDARDEKYGQIAVGKTGLATLAFMGAGHTHLSGTRWSAVTARALSFLTAAQDDASGHVGEGDAYSHGIATYTLAEAYALTKDPELRGPLETAVARIVRAQSRSKDPRLFGGWSYFFADDHTFDRWSRASITAWQVMALESARLGGIAIDDRVFADAAAFLENCRDDEGDWYRYSHDPARIGSSYPTLPASTPAALFALSILGRDIEAPEYAAARRFVVERAPRGFRFTSESDFVRRGQGNPYFHYYGTLALFRVGGAAWKSWNEALKRSLLPAQNANGSWTPIDVYARYARDDERDMSYTTAMCVLSLEIYYRYYLPLLKAGAVR